MDSGIGLDNIISTSLSKFSPRTIRTILSLFLRIVSPHQQLSIKERATKRNTNLSFMGDRAVLSLPSTTWSAFHRNGSLRKSDAVWKQ